MLSKKERKELSKIALGGSFPVCLIVGKREIEDSHIEVLNKALEANELAKVKVHVEDAESMKEAAAELQERSGAELVETRGHTAVYYRRSEKHPRYLL